MSPRLLLALTAALVLAACHGPKSDCEGTIRSLEACIDSNPADADCIVELITPEHRKKFGDRGLHKWAEESYFGVKDFSFTQVNASVSGTTCLVQTNADYTYKVRGQSPVDNTDEYQSYILHLINDKWYMEVPGSAKVQPF
jgi:hypothetical protein